MSVDAVSMIGGSAPVAQTNESGGSSGADQAKAGDFEKALAAAAPGEGAKASNDNAAADKASGDETNTRSSQGQSADARVLALAVPTEALVQAVEAGEGETKGGEEALPEESGETPAHAEPDTSALMAAFIPVAPQQPIVPMLDAAPQAEAPKVTSSASQQAASAADAKGVFAAATLMSELAPAETNASADAATTATDAADASRLAPEAAQTSSTPPAPSAASDAKAGNPGTEATAADAHASAVAAKTVAHGAAKDAASTKEAHKDLSAKELAAKVATGKMNGAAAKRGAVAPAAQVARGDGMASASGATASASGGTASATAQETATNANANDALARGRAASTTATTTPSRFAEARAGRGEREGELATGEGETTQGPGLSAAVQPAGAFDTRPFEGVVRADLLANARDDRGPRPTANGSTIVKDPTVGGLSAAAEGGKGADFVRAAEAVSHKRALGSEAFGEIVVPDLGRIEVRAHASADRVDVQVRADQEVARIVAAHSQELTNHVRVEVPHAVVDVAADGRSQNMFADGQRGSDGSRSGSGHSDARHSNDGSDAERPDFTPPRTGSARVRIVL